MPSSVVIRDQVVTPGTVTWLYLSGGFLTSVHPSDVTAVGAAALEGLWTHYLSKGIWRWGGDEGAPIRDMLYQLDPSLPDDIAAEVNSAGGNVRGSLSPAHFSAAIAAALSVVHEGCGQQWMYVHVPAMQPGRVA
jgi:hypothetical protein